MATCEHCGKATDASYPKDPEISGVLVCSEDCAAEMAPLPTGFGFVIGEGA